MVPSILIVEDDLTFFYHAKDMAGEKGVRSGDCKYAG